MANTYSQLYIHIVFAVKGRWNLISPNRRFTNCASLFFCYKHLL